MVNSPTLSREDKMNDSQLKTVKKKNVDNSTSILELIRQL